MFTPRTAFEINLNRNLLVIILATCEEGPGHGRCRMDLVQFLLISEVWCLDFDTVDYAVG
jgi:hypothetical protein